MGVYILQCRDTKVEDANEGPKSLFTYGGQITTNWKTTPLKVHGQYQLTEQSSPTKQKRGRFNNEGLMCLEAVHPCEGELDKKYSVEISDEPSSSTQKLIGTYNTDVQWESPRKHGKNAWALPSPEAAGAGGVSQKGFLGERGGDVTLKHQRDLDAQNSLYENRPASPSFSRTGGHRAVPPLFSPSQASFISSSLGQRPGTGPSLMKN